ncbi:MAG: hypothetical protein HUJ79_04215 [Firmicutes bacterium]|nr:hypothetical protein [Bacillota bacterium]
MKCGVKFCGGCNPRYQRGEAYRKIQGEMPQIEFSLAEENVEYDNLLIIGGCSACCPIYSQYTVKDEVIKMWSEDHIQKIMDTLGGKL